MKLLLTFLPLALLWAVASLAILLPVLGAAWVIDSLTDLTRAEGSCLMLASLLVFIHLLQSYMMAGARNTWLLSLLFSAFTVCISVLEGMLIAHLTNMTLFHSTLIAAATMFLLAYIFANTYLGILPPFLRRLPIQLLADEDDEEFAPPPPPSRRRRKSPTRSTSSR